MKIKIYNLKYYIHHYKYNAVPIIIFNNLIINNQYRHFIIIIFKGEH